MKEMPNFSKQLVKINMHFFFLFKFMNTSMGTQIINPRLRVAADDLSVI